MRVDFKQQKFRHPILRLLLTWLENETGFEFTESSSHREGDKGVHGCGRGEDLRCRNYEIGEAIQYFINSNWQYDPARPELKCCFLHGEGLNLHLHIQVHPKTKKIS